jgi:hypothetical protein
VCDGNNCIPCGAPGKACCDGASCNGGGCCDGASGKCVADITGACSAGQGTCSGGGCMAGACGKIGQACCAGGVGCTSPFSVCSAVGQCAPCGGNGERCCPGTHGNGFCGEPYACQRDTNRCAPCGTVGIQCCAGAVCAPGHGCSQDNVCQ